MPSDIEIHDPVSGRSVPVETLPASAIQALYHAVTGKTENFSKRLDGSVLIRFDDLQVLYDQISQNLEHYSLLAAPTVTVSLKTADNRTQRYSSWPRFRGFQTATNEITSEIAIKIEFVTTLPGLDTQQKMRHIGSIRLFSADL